MLPIFDFMRVIFINVVAFVSAVIDEVSYTLFSLFVSKFGFFWDGFSRCRCCCCCRAVSVGHLVPLWWVTRLCLKLTWQALLQLLPGDYHRCYWQSYSTVGGSWPLVPELPVVVLRTRMPPMRLCCWRRPWMPCAGHPPPLPWQNWFENWFLRPRLPRWSRRTTNCGRGG